MDIGDEEKEEAEMNLILLKTVNPGCTNSTIRLKEPQKRVYVYL